ncbi:MAG: hypothetical protein LBU34_12900 [Planctomycetaceae bacterium]|jgi:hypothetical protein|nr:hypothetical protein [Planctomycetaceae bacterium]
MYIANPIYDVVFKFLLEDEEVAKSFLSAIIEEEVLELRFATRERTLRLLPNKENSTKNTKKSTENAGELFLTVCRFDFSAQIATADGKTKTVMIELQKAKFYSDIMRFRRYLGLHYQNPHNVYGSKKNKKACQIYAIFLLGYDIGVNDCPIIQVDQNIKDGTTKESLEVTNEFIEGLHHRSWIIQLDQLKQRRRNNVEKLLSLFYQGNRTDNRHLLNVDENEYPETCRPIIRRLRMASGNEDVQAEMEMEDDFMKELQEKEHSVTKHKEALKESKKALKEKDKTIEEKNKTIEENKKALEEKDKKIEEEKKINEEKDKLIKELMEQLAKKQQ